MSTAVGRVLFNNSNYPKAVQVRMLGQDTSMLRGLIVNAIMDLMQPVEGISVTREERDRVTGWFVQLGLEPTTVTDEDRALFKRLEAAS